MKAHQTFREDRIREMVLSVLNNRKGQATQSELVRAVKAFNQDHPAPTLWFLRRSEILGAVNELIGTRIRRDMASPLCYDYGEELEILYSLVR